MADAVSGGGAEGVFFLLLLFCSISWFGGGVIFSVSLILSDSSLITLRTVKCHSSLSAFNAGIGL